MATKYAADNGINDMLYGTSANDMIMSMVIAAMTGLEWLCSCVMISL